MARRLNWGIPNFCQVPGTTLAAGDSAGALLGGGRRALIAAHSDHGAAAVPPCCCAFEAESNLVGNTRIIGDDGHLDSMRRSAVPRARRPSAHACRWPRLQRTRNARAWGVRSAAPSAAPSPTKSSHLAWIPNSSMRMTRRYAPHSNATTPRAPDSGVVAAGALKADG